MEHEYAEPVKDEDWKRIYEAVIEGSLRAFYGSAVFEEIRRTPRDRWLAVDVLDKWFFEGTKIWAAVDFAYRDAEGRVHLLDWKTGKERGADHPQVGTYALYARQKWDVAAGGGGGRPRLPGPGGGPAGRAAGVAADEATLERCRGEMRGSIAAMKAALADPARNAAVIEAFPQQPRTARGAGAAPTGAPAAGSDRVKPAGPGRRSAPPGRPRGSVLGWLPRRRNRSGRAHTGLRRLRSLAGTERRAARRLGEQEGDGMAKRAGWS